MTSELSFLLDILLNHKLPKPTREAVTARIKEVEARLTQPSQRVAAPSQMVAAVPPHLAGQSASTIAAMMRHEQNVPAPPIAVAAAAQVDHPQPVAVIAQTPAAQAALADRQAAISGAISGKPAPGRTSPRKF